MHAQCPRSSVDNVDTGWCEAFTVMYHPGPTPAGMAHTAPTLQHHPQPQPQPCTLDPAPQGIPRSLHPGSQRLCHLHRLLLACHLQAGRAAALGRAHRARRLRLPAAAGPGSQQDACGQLPLPGERGAGGVGAARRCSAQHAILGVLLVDVMEAQHP